MCVFSQREEREMELLQDGSKERNSYTVDLLQEDIDMPGAT